MARNTDPSDAEHRIPYAFGEHWLNEESDSQLASILYTLESKVASFLHDMFYDISGGENGFEQSEAFGNYPMDELSNCCIWAGERLADAAMARGEGPQWISTQFERVKNSEHIKGWLKDLNVGGIFEPVLWRAIGDGIAAGVRKMAEQPVHYEKPELRRAPPAGAGDLPFPEGEHATIAAQIDHWREECRLTIEQLAELVGVSDKSVKNHIGGKAQPSLQNIREYERVFSDRVGRKVKLAKTDSPKLP